MGLATNYSSSRQKIPNHRSWYNNHVRVRLDYGRDGLEADIPSENVTVLAPAFLPGLAGEAAAFRDAVRAPIGTRPLGELIRASERVAVVIPDITRPLPTERLLPWLFAELDHVPPRNFTIINGTGSHRANSVEELASMIGREVVARYRVVNHSAHDPKALAPAGKSEDGRTVCLNREYVEA